MQLQHNHIHHSSLPLSAYAKPPTHRLQFVVKPGNWSRKPAYAAVGETHRSSSSPALVGNNSNSDPFDPDNDFRLSDPYGRVEDVMTSWSLKTTTPFTMLKEVLPSFEKVSGVPVLDDTGTVVGVLTRKDIKKALKQNPRCLSEPVSMHMSSRPVTIRPHAHIAEAAGLMLAYKIHRIPVVDSNNKLVGLISRTDVFRPLLEPHDTRKIMYQIAQQDPHPNVELDEKWDYKSLLQEAEHAVGEEDDLNIKWQIKYLYDGDCDMCLALKSTLEGHDNGRGLISFVNIADMNYDPSQNEGVEFEDAMDTIHAIRRDGTIVKGTDALAEMYRVVGMGWVQGAANMPIVGALMDQVYDIVSKYRLPVSKKFKSAVTAVKRFHESEKGNEHCGATEECVAEW